MKILVTGGAGFIGSHLTNELLAAGHEVAVLDNLSTGKMKNLAQAESSAAFEFAELDIREDLSPFFRKHSFQAVYHLAAQANVQKSIADPAEDTSVNVTGTVNLLKTAEAAGVERFIFASSVAIFGEPAYDPVDESHPIQPLSPYGVSKAAATRYLIYFHKKDGFYTDTLVLANVYGPRQDPGGEGGVVAVFADQMTKGVSPVIHGTGEQSRDFVYVTDVVQAFLACLKETDRVSENMINIGTGQGTTVNELFALIKGITGFQGEAGYKSERPGDVGRLRVDPKRALKKLGWVADTTLTDGLASTIETFLHEKS